MLLTDCHCDYALSDVEETCFIFILEGLSPAGEEATLRRRGLVSAGLEGRLVDFGVAAIDL